MSIEYYWKIETYIANEDDVIDVEYLDDPVDVRDLEPNQKLLLSRRDLEADDYHIAYVQLDGTLPTCFSSEGIYDEGPYVIPKRFHKQLNELEDD